MKITILYYYLFLLLAEAWVVPHFLQLFRGFGEGKLPPPRLLHWCTLYSVQSNFQIFPISNPMQINMQLILIVFPLVEGGKCVVLTRYEFIIQLFSVCSLP